MMVFKTPWRKWQKFQVFFFQRGLYLQPIDRKDNGIMNRKRK